MTTCSLVARLESVESRGVPTYQRRFFAWRNAAAALVAGGSSACAHMLSTHFHVRWCRATYGSRSKSFANFRFWVQQFRVHLQKLLQYRITLNRLCFGVNCLMHQVRRHFLNQIALIAPFARRFGLSRAFWLSCRGCRHQSVDIQLVVVALRFRVFIEHLYTCSTGQKRVKTTRRRTPKCETRICSGSELSSLSSSEDDEAISIALGSVARCPRNRAISRADISLLFTAAAACSLMRRRTPAVYKSARSSSWHVALSRCTQRMIRCKRNHITAHE